jgi:hypothetical protein
VAERATRPVSGRLVRPLAALLLLPSVAAAQDRCGPASVWSLPSSHIVGPTVIRWMGDDLLLFGERVLVVGKETTGRLILRDSLAVALRVPDGRGTPSVIPRPVDGERFEFSRGFETSRGLTMLWGVPADTAPDPFGRERHDLRVASWDGARWQSIRTIGRFTMRTSFAPQRSSELVHHDGVHYFAMIVEDSIAPYTRVAVVSDSGGRWRSHVFEVGLRALSAVALGVDGGRLVAHVLGVPRVVPADGTSYFATPFVMRLEDDGWSPPRPLGGSPEGDQYFPKLVRTEDGLLAVWTSVSATGSALLWRRVSFDAPFGPIQRMEGTGFVMQGQPPFDALLSVLTVDGRARILRLRADGFDLLDEFRLTGNFAPAIGGSRERPIVAYPVLDDPADAGGGHVEIRDLRCALQRAEQGRTR